MYTQEKFIIIIFTRGIHCCTWTCMYMYMYLPNTWRLFQWKCQVVLLPALRVSDRIYGFFLSEENN